MNIQHNLLETKYSSQDPDEVTQCQDNSCFRSIACDDPCFVDTETSTIYCEKCGQCLRYSRKKQKEREDKGITEVPLIKGLDY